MVFIKTNKTLVFLDILLDTNFVNKNIKAHERSFSEKDNDIAESKAPFDNRSQL